MPETVLPAAIHRPARKGRLRVRMPYAPGNRAWIRRVLGANTRPEWEPVQQVWKISRPHLWALADAMAERFGAVDIFLDSRGLERCDKRCIEARGDECECQCDGRNHGGLTERTAGWVEVGATTLVHGTEERRRHFRKTADGRLVEFP